MKKEHFLLAIIVFIGAYLRFSHLDWGKGYFFHPDENNMARAVSNLCFNLPTALNSSSLSDRFGLRLTVEDLGVEDLKSPASGSCNMNPKFYAYGQFPLYLAHFSNYIYKSVVSHFPPTASRLEYTKTSFTDAVIWLRFYSALASTLTILIVFLIARKLLTFNFALLTAALAAFTPGLIQAAHFGTTESLLTFFFMLILYLSLKLMTTTTNVRMYYLSFILLGLFSGLALATKLTAIYFLAAPIFAILLNKYKARSTKRKIQNRIQKLFEILKIDNWNLLWILDFGFWILLYLIITLVIAVTFSPYNILKFNDFMSSLRYESAVATGQAKVFYTRQFENTTPFLFQLTKIFPFALGLPILLLGSLGFGILLGQLEIRSIRNSLIRNKVITIVFVAFLSYFVLNSLLYTKWTRFMTPTLPFFAIFAAYAIYWIHKKTASYEAVFGVGKESYLYPLNNRKKSILPLKQFVKSIKWRREGDSNSTRLSAHQLLSGSGASPVHPPLIYIFTIFIILLSILPGVLFYQIYTRPDTRASASAWIYKNIPKDSYILSETGNVVDIPVQIKSYEVINFDFYHLDENPYFQEELITHLLKANYIIIPSRRIYANHTRPTDKYPATSSYYSALFSGQLGFKLAHTEKPFTCYLLLVTCYLNNEQSEETFSVFDHPTIRIYKKTKQYNRDSYEKILFANLDN